jgi:PEP-CTERM motif
MTTQNIKEPVMSRLCLSAARAALALSVLASAAAQAVTLAPAPGSATFSWGLSAENLVSQTFNYKSGELPNEVFTSGGLQSVSSGNVQASVNAWADPVAGAFKAITSVQMRGDTPINIADAYARLDLTDTVRVTGPGATATLSITMDYDTTFSGLGMTPFERYEQISHFMQADSSRYVSASYVISNPDFDPAAQCIDYGSDGVYCPPEAQPLRSITESAGKTLFREWALGGPQGVYSNGDAENMRYTGQVQLNLVVPTNVDVALNFQLYNGARCFHLANCDLVTDASHSDHIGLTVGEGFAFSSASGFQYLGLAAPVPEPTTLGMMLLGLSGMALAVRRRRDRQA